MAARLRPVHGILLVAFFMGAVLLADWAFDRGHGRRFEKILASPDGQVRVQVAGLAPGQVRFYEYLNRGNQEVRFLVGRDRSGALQVAFDAAETDFKRKLGFRQEGDWLVNNKCETALRLEEVNAGTGGCRPVPLKHLVVGGQAGQTLLLREDDLLAGWRYFR